jgi:hypothetical protein
MREDRDSGALSADEIAAAVFSSRAERASIGEAVLAAQS